MSGNSSFMHIPRVLHPFAPGDRQIWFSGVTRGTRLTIQQGTQTIGETLAASPVVAVPVEEISAPIHYTAELGDQIHRSDVVLPLREPTSTGAYSSVKAWDVDYGEFEVETHQTPDGEDGGFKAPLTGRVYMPAEVDGSIPDRVRHVPLVIIAHGYWPDLIADADSYRGYDWLTEHLARWGMVVCSISLSEMNRKSERLDSVQQWSRAEVIYTMIERLLGDTDVAPFIDADRIGLIGHSVGGEAVVLSQMLNRDRRVPYGIRGIVSIAPTNHLRESTSVDTSYLLIHGSMDYLLGSGASSSGLERRWNGFRLLDRAWHPRSLVWIDRAGHDAYNTVWYSGQSFERDDPRLLEPERQRGIGLGFITAFFADVLLGLTPYRGYLTGPMQPRTVGDVMVRRHYQPPDIEIIDDSGDANDQFLLEEEDPPDKRVSRRGEPVRAVGPGLDRWEIALTGVRHTPHRARMVDLAWLHEDLLYEVSLGALEVEPDGWISLRVAQHYDEDGDGPDETWNRIGDDIDFLIELDDGTHRARVRAGLLDMVRYPLPACAVYSVFQTLRLPIDAFTATDPELDIGNLQWLRLRPLNDRGRVLLDDIAFETTPVTAPSEISMLRAHQLGGGYGPRNDALDGEVVVQLAGRPGESFGFPLRTNDDLPAAEAILSTLRSALVRGSAIRLGYRWTGPTVREIVHVEEA